MERLQQGFICEQMCLYFRCPFQGGNWANAGKVANQMILIEVSRKAHRGRTAKGDGGGLWRCLLFTQPLCLPLSNCKELAGNVQRILDTLLASEHVYLLRQKEVVNTLTFSTTRWWSLLVLSALRPLFSFRLRELEPIIASTWGHAVAILKQWRRKGRQDRLSSSKKADRRCFHNISLERALFPRLFPHPVSL